MWIFGWSLVKSAMMAFSDAYSAPWLAGGGGVKPIHMTRLTVPPGPVELAPLPPPEQAAASSARPAAIDRPIRVLLARLVVELSIWPHPSGLPVLRAPRSRQDTPGTSANGPRATGAFR